MKFPPSLLRVALIKTALRLFLFYELKCLAEALAKAGYIPYPAQATNKHKAKKAKYKRKI